MEMGLDQLSEYERLRLSNIARNNGVLKDLGLGKTEKPSRQRFSGGSRKRKSPGSNLLPPSQPSRRSERNQGFPPPNYRDIRDVYLGGRSGLGVVVENGEEAAAVEEGESATESAPTSLPLSRKNSSIREVPLPSEDSSRAMQCSVSFALGTECLGKAVPDG
jgi:hypothetical protein